MEDTLRTVTSDSPLELRARALRYLARREYSRAELAKKLASHAESSQVLVQLLDSLETRKQLSDERYAEVRAHQLSRKYGTDRIRLDLHATGVAEEISERIIAELASAELVRATEILQRKYGRSAVTAEELAQRSRFLRQRGFPHEIIRCALGASSASRYRR